MYTFFHGTKILIISNANSFSFLTNGSGLCTYWKHQISNTEKVPKEKAGLFKLQERENKA